MSNVRLIDDNFLKNIKEFCSPRKHIQLSLGISNNTNHEKYLFNTKGMTNYVNYSYEIGSITKVITGLLLTKVIEDKSLSLNDTVDKYIDFKDKKKYYPTIKSLITHTSGCADEYISFSERDYEQQTYVNPVTQFSREDIIDFFEKQDYTPEKSDYNYSNLGTGIIGLVLEHLYKKPYKDTISRFLTEYNLNTIKTQVPKNIIKGYTDGVECGNWYWPDGSALNAIGCLYSDLDGLLKLGDIFCQNSEGLFNENAKGLVTINEEPKVQIATFWGKYVDEDIITHSGSSGCFSSIIAIDLKNKRSIVMMANYLDENDFAMAFMQLKKMQLIDIKL